MLYVSMRKFEFKMLITIIEWMNMSKDCVVTSSYIKQIDFGRLQSHVDSRIEIVLIYHSWKGKI